MNYRVLVKGLTYPTDIRILRRLVAGEAIPMNQRGMCRPRSVGDIVGDIPRSEAAGLLGAGWIEEVIDDG